MVDQDQEYIALDTVGLKEAFGQKNVPQHKNTAGTIRNCNR